MQEGVGLSTPLLVNQSCDYTSANLILLAGSLHSSCVSKLLRMAFISEGYSGLQIIMTYSSVRMH